MNRFNVGKLAYGMIPPTMYAVEKGNSDNANAKSLIAEQLSLKQEELFTNQENALAGCTRARIRFPLTPITYTLEHHEGLRSHQPSIGHSPRSSRTSRYTARASLTAGMPP
jgi:hypothetical protein